MANHMCDPKKICKGDDNYISILLNEYQACHRQRNHYASIGWTIGSLFLGASIVLYAASFETYLIDKKSEVVVLGLFSFALIFIWYLYNQHVNPWVLASIVRVHQIEQELRNIGGNIQLHKFTYIMEPEMSGFKLRGIYITLSFLGIVILSWFYRFSLLFTNHSIPLAVICISMLYGVYYIHTKKFNIYNLGEEIDKILKENSNKTQQESG